MRKDIAARIGAARWDLHPLWSLAPRVDCKNDGLVETNLLSLSYGNIIRKDIGEAGGLRPESYETYNIVEAGDIVLRMTDLQNDKKSIRTGYATERGIITSAYITVRADPSKVEPRFLSAVLRAYDLKKTFYEMGAGVRQTLKYNELADIPIPLPPLIIQRRMAEYLDRETNEIDAMMEKLNELSAALETRRRRAIDSALRSITERIPLWAVTDGVIDCPHTTPVVDNSGAAEAIRTTSVRNGRYRPGNGIKVSAETANERNGIYPPRPGDVFFTREAPAGEACLVPNGNFCLGQRMVLIRPIPGVLDGRFLVYALYTDEVQDEFALSAGGSTVVNLKLGTIRSTRIPSAQFDDQIQIADHLDEVTAKVDAMLAKVSDLKSLLLERRAALITDVVTGKKEVA